MSKNSISKTSIDEYPEITQADFDRAVFRKNLKPVENKQRITIMLDAGVINYFKAKAGKRGYQTLINESLKRIIAGDQIGQSNIEETFRRIIREELSGIKVSKT
ncbi:MAG: BrnA antitoxin family protein [Desulfobacterales bacterium]|nr:BrnA antitoxin family protein [Desulfobacterales bacterium]